MNAIACVYRDLNNESVLMPACDQAVLRVADSIVIGDFSFTQVCEQFNRSAKHRVATPLGQTRKYVLCEPELIGGRKRYVPMRHPLAVVRKLKVYLRDPDGRGRARAFIIE